jgi:hypothetical protein
MHPSQKNEGNLLATYASMILRRMKSEIGSFFGQYPILLLPLELLARRTTHSHLAVNKHTELVIEAFPRSGNTFAVVAFTLTQHQPVKVAHHLHAPGQIIWAVRGGIPTLVIIRKPSDAILSLLIRAPYLSVRQALRQYIRFYSKIYPYRKGYILAAFEDVTNNFRQVTEKINQRFATNFRLFEHTPENLEKCFQIIEQIEMNETGRNRVSESTISRPSQEREIQKVELRKRLHEKRVQPLLERANTIYNDFITQSENFTNS